MKISPIFTALFLGLFICISMHGISLAKEQQGYAEVYNPAGIREDGSYVDTLLTKTIKETKRRGPQLAGEFPAVKIEKIKIKADAATEVNELFYKRGWTDGLPVVVPTQDKVKVMLRGTDLDPGFVIAVLDPMGGQATVEKIAVNAVMAGCKPEHMPVLIAAVEAISDSAFDLKGISNTTSPDTPLLILTGPIIKDIDFNADTNTMGRGRLANSTIGRAIQLIINNVGGAWPGVNDLSNIGSPAEYGMVIAENAEANPWSSLNSDIGFPKNANVATLVGVEGIRGVVGIGRTSEGFLRLVAEHMSGLAAQRPRWPVVILIIAKDTAIQLAKDGWTKESMREAILKFGSVPLSKYKERFNIPRWSHEIQNAEVSATSPNEMIPQPFIDQFIILVAGGFGEKSMILPGWFGASKAVSKEIRLPANWQEVIKAGH
jgi:hypothetical protein